MSIKKYTVDSSDTLDIVISKIMISSERTVFVLFKKKVIGTISEGDVLRSLLQKKNLKSPAKNIMHKSFKFLNDKNDTSTAKKIFKRHNVSIIPILNKDFELISLIKMKDLLN